MKPLLTVFITPEHCSIPKLTSPTEQRNREARQWLSWMCFNISEEETAHSYLSQTAINSTETSDANSSKNKFWRDQLTSDDVVVVDSPSRYASDPSSWRTCKNRGGKLKPRIAQYTSKYIGKSW